MKMGRPSGLTAKDIIFNDISEIDVERVIVKNRKREADEKKVNELVESIKELGLISPIYVNRSGDDYILIAGLHRLTAYKKLGIDRIPAKITDIDDIHSELAEIDENLVRAELHYLDRAEILKRRQEIYEELHPEAKAKAKGAIASNKKQGKGNFDANDTMAVASFTEDTAKKTNLSERTIQRDLQIAKNLDDKVKKQIKDKKISKKDALEIARLKKEDQQKAIDNNGNIPAKEIKKTRREAEKLILNDNNEKWKNYKERYQRYDEAVNKLREEKINEIIEAYKLDTYTYEEGEKILEDICSGGIEEAKILLAPFAEKEAGKKPEQKTDEEEDKSIYELRREFAEDKIKSFNSGRTDIVLELGEPKEIKSHNLPPMATRESSVIKIGFKSFNLVVDLINFLDKAFPVK
ncbi:MAG: ParB/RepB/Spo0J family partition protein [bacterium]